MTTNSRGFVVPRCFSLLAVMFMAASPAHSQGRNPVVFDPVVERLGSQVLRGPGSQIGVTTRDRIAAEMRDAAGFWARFAAQQDGVVIIDEVRADSPASRAGLRKGDVVTRFDGEPVPGSRQFSKLVAETPPGWTVKMTIIRDGKTRDISITPTL